MAAAGGVSFLHLLHGLPGEPSWMGELLDGNHLPLRVIVYESNAEKVRFEVTRVEPQVVALACAELVLSLQPTATAETT